LETPPIVFSLVNSTRLWPLSEVWHASVTRAPGCAKVHGDCRDSVAQVDVPVDVGSVTRWEQFLSKWIRMDSRDRLSSIYPLSSD